MRLYLQSVRDGDRIRGLRGRYGSSVLVVHEPSPNEPYARPSLIPEASVIQAASYPAIPEPEHSLACGDHIVVKGHGEYKIVRDRNNADWPRLVPQFGPRYYVVFKGFGDWAILDRERDGQYADATEWRERLGMHRYRFENFAEAHACAALMSASILPGA